MNRTIAAIAIVAFTVHPTTALAQWQALVIPGMEPLLIASESEDWALVVSCTNASDVTIAYIEKAGTAAARAGGTLAVQADTDQHYTFDATRYQHNGDFVGYRTIWTDYATLAVQSMGWATSTVSVHLELAGAGGRVTKTLSAAGAADAVAQLLVTCGAE